MTEPSKKKKKKKPYCSSRHGGAVHRRCCATSTAGWRAPSATTTSCRSSAAPSATPSRVTYATCALHCVSYGLLYLALPAERRDPGCALLPADAGRARLGDVGQQRPGACCSSASATTWPAQRGPAREPGRARSRASPSAPASCRRRRPTCSTRRRWPRSACWPPASPTRSATRSRRSARWCRCSSAATATPTPATSWPWSAASSQRIQTTLRELVEFSRPASTERTRARPRRHPRRGAEHRQVLQGHQRRHDRPRDVPARPAAAVRRPRPAGAGVPQPRPQRHRRHGARAAASS